MLTQNNDDNKSFADILLQAALSASTKQESQENPKTNPKGGIMYIVGYVLGFLLYCLFFHLGYSVISAKFLLPILSFWESIQVCLGLLSFSALLLRRK